MLFNSLTYFFFLPVVFCLYWFFFRKKQTVQNYIILIASYFFYACWDYRFLFLLVFSTVLDYYSGHKIHQTSNAKAKKIWFWISIGMNLGVLGFFKYFNFFTESFEQLFHAIGLKADFWTLKVILPVGISFYTFHGLSYVIDIYKERIVPEKKFINYSVFVCFFPLLVAGPIERASHLLPQIKVKRKFDYVKAVDGLRQMLWGLFKKVVIADNCATYVNDIFQNYEVLPGSTLMIGAVLFSVQIYCDFSGYTDIALGTARLFGFELMRNFNFPYLSKSVTEFWRRWHISLSTWFNDYIFTPLVIQWRDKGKWGIYMGLMVTFFLAGLWHGAGWNFIVYGVLHGILLVFELATKKQRKKFFTKLPSTITSILTQTLTFLFVTFVFVFFRSASIGDAFNYLGRIFSSTICTVPAIDSKGHFFIIVFFSAILFTVEWFQRTNTHGLHFAKNRAPSILNWSIYTFLIFVIILFGSKQESFIYFQF